MFSSLFSLLLLLMLLLSLVAHATHHAQRTTHTLWSFYTHILICLCVSAFSSSIALLPRFQMHALHTRTHSVVVPAKCCCYWLVSAFPKYIEQAVCSCVHWLWCEMRELLLHKILINRCSTEEIYIVVEWNNDFFLIFKRRICTCSVWNTHTHTHRHATASPKRTKNLVKRY